MPQLDRVIIFSQIFWLFIIFSSLYAILTHFFLPLFLKSLKSRKQIIELNSLEVSKLNNRVFTKHALLKQKLLQHLLLIESFLLKSYIFQNHFEVGNHSILIDEKIALASINYSLYCDNFILKNILFYPKFLNSKV